MKIADITKEIDMSKVHAYVRNYADARKVAAEMHQTTDFPDFVVRKRARVVAVQHMDGSYMEYHSACFRELSKDFVAIFTEHHGFYVYHKEDIESVREWLRPKYLYYNQDR